MPTGPYQVTCERNSAPDAEFDSAKLLVKSSSVGGGGGDLPRKISTTENQDSLVM